MAKRPLNKCSRCSHSWRPRGQDVSSRCPSCRAAIDHIDYKSNAIRAAKRRNREAQARLAAAQSAAHESRLFESVVIVMGPIAALIVLAAAVAFLIGA